MDTEKLVLRRLERAELEAFRALCAEPSFQRSLLASDEVTRSWCEREITRSTKRFDAGEPGLWLVCLSGVARPIGVAGFRVISQLGPSPHLVVALRPGACDAQSLHRAVRAALARAGSRHNSEHVVAAVDARDTSARRVLEALGFVRFEDTNAARASSHRLESGFELSLCVARTWSGEAAAGSEQVDLTLCFRPGEVSIAVDAPFHDDPAPSAAPGSTDRLWEHEVAEVFFVGDEERYLEVELGPHGHHLVLALHGVRNIVAVHDDAIAYEVARTADRWQGLLRLPSKLLPPGLDRLNAFAIHGSGASRRYLAWHPVPGAKPDFHRLEAFAPIAPLPRHRAHAVRAIARGTHAALDAAGER